MSCEGWRALGCVGVLIGITAACDGKSPTSPSNTTGSNAAFERPSGSSGLGSSSIFAGSSITSVTTNGTSAPGTADTARSGMPSRRKEGAQQSKRQYCENLSSGHKHYERCQAWLNGDRGAGPKGRKAGPKGRKGGKARRSEYCKNLSPGHKHYERCQAWLNSGKGKGGTR